MTPDESDLEIAAAIAREVRAAGGRALVVGGWVRDRLMGHPSKDMDVEVFGVDAAGLKGILQAFGRVNTVGESFTVYKVAGLDVSLPRRESKTGRGHRGFTVSGDPALSFRDAARRRDFTINAISWDPLTEEYVDPFDGRGDLQRRVLRAVDATTFADDSLRVLRAIQFAARFEFTVDPDTKALCRSIPIDDLPAERLWGEIEKLLLRARKPSIGFALAQELGIVERLFPELDALVGCSQEAAWHPEGDVWVHTLLVIDEARARIDDLEYPRQVAVMLGAVCHDLGKPLTTAFIDGRIRSLDHEEEGIPPSTALLDTLNVHSMQGYDVRREVLGIVANHLKPGMFCKAQPPWGTARSAGWRRRWTWSSWRASRGRTAKGAAAGSTVPRWTGSSSARVSSASSTRRPSRSSRDGTSSSSAWRPAARSGTCSARCTSASWMAASPTSTRRSRWRGR